MINSIHLRMRSNKLRRFVNFLLIRGIFFVILSSLPHHQYPLDTLPILIPLLDIIVTFLILESFEYLLILRVDISAIL